MKNIVNLILENNDLAGFVFELQSNITIEYTSTPLSAMTGNQ